MFLFSRLYKTWQSSYQVPANALCREKQKGESNKTARQDNVQGGCEERYQIFESRITFKYCIARSRGVFHSSYWPTVLLWWQNFLEKLSTIYWTEPDVKFESSVLSRKLSLSNPQYSFSPSFCFLRAQAYPSWLIREWTEGKSISIQHQLQMHRPDSLICISVRRTLWPQRTETLKSSPPGLNPWRA